MICPQCNQELKMPNRGVNNALAYNNIQRVTTECCYKIIKITPIRSYTIEADAATCDDWGVPIGEEGKKAYEELDQDIQKQFEKRIKTNVARFKPAHVL
jgi:hypothetical protein